MSKKRKATRQPNEVPPTDGDQITIRPRWYAPLRELWVGPILVKAFTGPAKNQELIFQSYQEINWQPLLFSPLLPNADLEPCERLHKAVERLNGNQRTPLVRFRPAHHCTAFAWQWAVTAAGLRTLLAAAANTGEPTATR
jgi:hypothetical protein